MLSDPGDLVVDPFAGSCVTGEVCERLKRHWLCYETVEEYLKGARGRFVQASPSSDSTVRPLLLPGTTDLLAQAPVVLDTSNSYKVSRPDVLWTNDVVDEAMLPPDGGRTRPEKLPVEQTST